MRNRLLMVGILALLLVMGSVNDADARGWGRGRCRTHRLFIAPPIPRIIVPAPIIVPRARYYGRHGYYGRPRYHWHRGHGRWGR